MKFTSKVRPLCVLAFLLYTSSLSHGSILHVPETYLTVQEAIDASSTTIEDTILIEPGIYHESLSIQLKSLTLASRFLLDSDTSWISQTALDGDESFRVLNIVGNGDQRVRLIGMTFQHGYVDTTQFLRGGGIYSFKTDIQIEGCRLIGNRAHNGSAAFLDSATAIVQRSVIAENYANPHLFNLFLRGDSLLVEECLFLRNTGDGLRGMGRGVVANSEFRENQSQADGGGALLSGVSWTVASNLFINNRAWGGGGLAVFETDSTLIENNQFIQNEAIYNPVYVSGSGGAIEFLLGQYTRIVNNDFTRNVAAEGAAIFAGGSADISHNVFTDNRGNYVGLISVQPVNNTAGYVFLRRNLIQGNRIDPSIPSPPDVSGLLRLQFPSSLTVEEVDFIDNIGHVIQYPDTGLHLQNNYWGDPSGPYNPLTNPEGLGDSVMVPLPVFVEPWSTEHFWAANVEPDTNLVDFGVVEVGETASRELTLRNTGVETLVVRGVFGDDPAFTLDLGTDSLVLASEESAEVTVRFAPQDDLPHLDTLLFDCNDPEYQWEILELRGNWVHALPDWGEDHSMLPFRYDFAPAQPNPFNPSTVVRVDLPRSSSLRVEVFDILGRRVALLHEGPTAAGNHRYSLDGSHLSSGLYFLRASSLDFGVRTQKVILLK